jgi:hypothetical protein
MELALPLSVELEVTLFLFVNEILIPGTLIDLIRNAPLNSGL